MYPSTWEQQGYSEMLELLLDMTEPIQGTGKIVTDDSGFCVTKSVLALHVKGVFGQFLIKKRRYWPAQVPGNQIDTHMMAKSLGEMETFVQDLNGVPFFVHCTRNDKYMTKIVLTHGTLEEKEDHSTWRCVSRSWKMFNYVETFLRRNGRKLWVGDINNHRHDPIGLETT
jgi:hypothetical protein